MYAFFDINDLENTTPIRIERSGINLTAPSKKTFANAAIVTREVLYENGVIPIDVAGAPDARYGYLVEKFVIDHNMKTCTQMYTVQYYPVEDTIRSETTEIDSMSHSLLAKTDWEITASQDPSREVPRPISETTLAWRKAILKYANDKKLAFESCTTIEELLDQDPIQFPSLESIVAELSGE